MKYLFLVIFTALLSAPTYAVDTWTEFRNIDDIYTYADEDTLSVYLNGVSCPNTKNYFSIHPSKVSNAKQMISMVLAAKMAKTQINVLYDSSSDSAYCYFKGVRLRN